MYQLVLIAALVATSGVVQGQVYGPGACPTYQTSELFTVDKVNTLVNEGGLIPYLSAGTLSERYQSCQFLKLTDETKFAYTYKDGNNRQNTVTGTYETIPSSFKQPGHFRLHTGESGILGSDLTGYVNLHPILIDSDKEVYVACTGYGVFHAQFAYTFMKPGARRSGDVGDIQVDLISKGIPLAEEMTTKDQTCFETDPIMRRRVPQFITNLRANGFDTNLGEKDRLQGTDDRRAPNTRDPLGAISNLVQTF